MSLFKKIPEYLSIFLCITIISANSVNALTKEDERIIDDRIASVGFGKMLSADPQKEITNIFKKLDSYTEKKDLKKIRELFSDNFINNDGYDIDVYMKSTKNGFDAYQNRKVTTVINSINVNDNYAVVHVTENGEADTYPSATSQDSGFVIATADIYYYLQKESNKWKIVSANVIDESCSLLYGSAKNIYFALNVPSQVKSGSEYTATLSFAPMKDILVSASITKEPIIYPLPFGREPFKTVKNDGMLERILTANSDNYNEYAVASIGISRPKIIAQNEFNLELIGTAFVLRRVNIFKPMPQKLTDKKNSLKQGEVTLKSKGN